MEYQIPPSRNPSRDLTLPSESKPDTPTGTAITPFSYSDFLRECADALREKRGLLELSPEGLRHFLPYLGVTGITSIAHEIEYYSNQILQSWFNTRYNAIRAPRFHYDEFVRDIDNSAKIPDAALEAAQLTLTLFESHLSYAVRHGHNQKMKPALHVCNVFDGMLRHTLDITKDAEEPWHSGWAPQHILNRIYTVRTKGMLALERLATKNRVKLQGNPIFVRSMHYLQRSLMRHARDTGVMLAMKTTGTHLPPELVEMISEHFHDKELLKTLEDDLARRNRETAEAKAAVRDGKVNITSKGKDRKAK